MPSIELDGRSESTFVLIDGKITRVDSRVQAPMGHEGPRFRGLDRE